MKDYEVKTSIGCHIFLDAESYEELLSAILKWWAGIREKAKTIEAIALTVDGKWKNASVHWSYLTKEEAKEVDQELLKLRQAPPVTPEIISGN